MGIKLQSSHLDVHDKQFIQFAISLVPCFKIISLKLFLRLEGKFWDFQKPYNK